MAERPPDNPRPTFIHNRGEFLQPTDRVAARRALDPAALAQGRRSQPAWLWPAGWSSPDNPLSGRVTMNRQWAAFFGRGLVRTAEDFGYQGEPPSHPELLDWLALELPRQGLSLKRMHKLIVMSATYQQSSRATPELLAKDPENRLLARGPRVRLEAELIRDAALRVSGLLCGAASAGRASSRRSRRASRPRGRTAASTGKSARRATAIAADCTPSPSGPLRSPWRRPSMRPAAKSASPAARFPTRRCRH